MKSGPYRTAAWLAGVVVIGLACSGIPDIRALPRVESAPATVAAADLERIALVPFAAGLELGRTASPQLAMDAPALVTRFVGDALERAGRFGVSPDRVALALAEDGTLVLPVDPVWAAQRSGAIFGATSILVGEVKRYPNRGADPPAVELHFEAHLHSTRDGRRLWSATVHHAGYPASPAPARDRPDAAQNRPEAAAPAPEDLARRGAADLVAALLAAEVAGSAAVGPAH